MIAEAFATVNRTTRQGLPCPVAKILEGLETADATALVHELDRPVGDPRRLSNAVIARTLTDSGQAIHPKGIERHRNRTCRCYSGRVA